MTNPLDRSRKIAAVLFDLDGTLYAQSPVRVRMAIELLALPFESPLLALRRWRALQAYRRAQEHLRHQSGRSNLAQDQLAAAASAAGLPVDEVERLVHQWMLTKPLKYLRRHRAPGIEQLLDALAKAGVRAGILSDYPAEAKLDALGLAGRFSPVLCSADADIAALKPDPHGFLHACTLWRLDPKDVLMVGDRADADAAGAEAAGMSCVIIDPRAADIRRESNHLVLPSLERLKRALEDG